MENKEQFISSGDLFPLIMEQLRKGNRVRFTVSGISMAPWLINNRDQVELISVEGIRLKKGDIILFQPSEGKYVLHRITQVTPEGYITTGDGNLHRDGMVSREALMAKAVRMIRKGHTMDCESLRWKMIFRVWMLLFPIRGFLLKSMSTVGKFKSNICRGSASLSLSVKHPGKSGKKDRNPMV